MAEKTPAQKRAQINYMEKFKRIELRVSPNLYEKIKSCAVASGESVNTFIAIAAEYAVEHAEKAAAPK